MVTTFGQTCLSQKKIDYRQVDFLTFAQQMTKKEQMFDVVTAMEMIEHVDDQKLYIQCMASLLKPGGYLVISTLNRTLISFLGGIIAAEYLLGWVQRGTHQFNRFLKPSELVNYAYDENLGLKKLQGLTWEFGNKRFVLSNNVSINYLVLLQKRIH